MVLGRRRNNRARLLAIGPIVPPWQKYLNECRESAETVMKEISVHQAKLYLIQAATSMAIGGATRAQVKDVVSRASQDYNMTMSLWEAGQLFSALGIRTVSSHGKSRLVLEVDELQRHQQQLSREVDRLQPQIDETLIKFTALQEKVSGMEEKMASSLALIEREKELRQQVSEDVGLEARVTALQQDLQDKVQLVDQANALESEIRELEERVQAMPPIDDRKQTLETTLLSLEEEEQHLSGQEKDLASKLTQLERRKGLVSLAKLNVAIDKARQELDQLQTQLTEKRSLAAKLLGRKS